MDRLAQELGDLPEQDRWILLKKLPLPICPGKPATEDLDAVIRSVRKWDDQALMKLVDAIFSERPAVRKALLR